MRFRWANIFGFILLVTVVILFVRYRQSIALFVGNIERIGPHHGADEQTLGLIALGIIAVCIVAALRIITRK